MSDLLDALHAAIRADDVDAARTIVRDHPDISSTIDQALPHGAFGGTAMLAAVQRRNLDLVDVLLAAGADINRRSHWWAGGFGVLDDADPALAQALIARGATLTAHAAARLGRIDALHALVAADRTVVHARGGDGQLPLHFAATVEIADLLLAHGADIDAIDVDHESTAAQWMLGTVEGPDLRSRHDVARHLVAHGCRTDILMAAALGDTALVRARLDAEPASIETRVSTRWFPMKDVRAGGTIYIWTLGAYRSAHLIARAFKHDAVFDLLMERSPVGLKLTTACELGDEAEAARLRSAYPDALRALAPDDHRLVADAAELNNEAAVRLMLDAGWPIDARGKHGAMPLHWAGFHGNAAMAHAILRHHPPLEARSTDFDGTPLGWTVYGSREGWCRATGDYAAVAEALVEAGARVPENAAEHASDAVRCVLGRYNRGG